MAVNSEANNVSTPARNMSTAKNHREYAENVVRSPQTRNPKRMSTNHDQAPSPSPHSRLLALSGVKAPQQPFRSIFRGDARNLADLAHPMETGSVRYSLPEKCVDLIVTSPRIGRSATMALRDKSARSAVPWTTSKRLSVRWRIGGVCCVPRGRSS